MKKMVIALVLTSCSTTTGWAENVQKVSTGKFTGCLMTTGLFGGGLLLASAAFAPFLVPALMVGCITMMPEKK